MVVPYRHFYSCNALRILRSSSCLRVLRSTSQFVILLAAPSHSSRQLLCPSQPFTQPLLHYVSLHLVRCPCVATVPGILIKHTSPPIAGCTCTSASLHTSLTGFHYTSFRRVSFSTVQSTRCHTFLLAGRPSRLRSLCAANCFVRTSHSQSCTSVHLHTSAACMPFGKYMQAAPYVASIVAAPWPCFFSLIRKGAATLLLAPSGGSPSPPFVPLSGSSWLALLPTLPRRYSRRPLLLFCRRRFYRCLFD